MIIASVQLAISDWNGEHGTNFHLPKAAFASFAPMFLFACYAIVVKFFSPVKKSNDGVLSVRGGSATSLPAVRYTLSLTFAAGALLSTLLTLRRLIAVFHAFPTGWYDTYLPWKWF